MCVCINVLNWFTIFCYQLQHSKTIIKKKKTKNNIKYLSVWFALTPICLPCRGDLDHHLGTLKSNLGSIGLFILYLSSINNHLLRKSNASTWQRNNIPAYTIINITGRKANI